MSITNTFEKNKLIFAAKIQNFYMLGYVIQNSTFLFGIFDLAQV